MILIFILSLLFSYVHAGCPAIGIQNVTGKILTCQTVKSPDGFVVEFTAESAMGPSMGMDVKKGEKYKLFAHPDQKIDCQKLPANTKVCINLQLWCRMVGLPPHKAGHTFHNLRLEKCQ